MVNWERHWYRSDLSGLAILLLPLSWLFYLLVSIRRFLYQKKILKTHQFPVPVLVVGNITVGGTGKTPFTIWLIDYLRKNNYRPGIVTRGVGGKEQKAPRWVGDNSLPQEVGDEALLLMQRCQCPVVVGVDRVAATQELLEKTDCNVVISDDGLQHYRLGRTLEIALIDGTRDLGNRCLLPAGPLREPVKRLQTVDMIVRQGGVPQPGEVSMQLVSVNLVAAQDKTRQMPLTDLNGKKIHAIAAIGNPQRFFASLRAVGAEVIEHVFPDHYLYQANDLAFADDLLVVMTEKDVVKCRSFANEKHWFVPVDVVMDESQFCCINRI